MQTATKPADSFIQYNKSSTSFVGEDAVSLFAAAGVCSALRLYAKHRIKVNRAYTPSAMLAFATRTTGKTYKRGQYEQAAADLDTWIQTMKAALPHLDGEGKPL